jgi:putative heme degradation protein
MLFHFLFYTDVDIFGVTTNAIVCLNVNTHCMNVAVGIKRNVIAIESWVNGGSFNPTFYLTLTRVQLAFV